MTRSSKATPVRQALRESSFLQRKVAGGLGAMQGSHRDHVDEAIRGAFADSLDADEALRKGYDQENRWDYLLGHRASGAVIGLEPHSAKEDEIGTVIRKRQRALEQLRGHLRDGARIARWFWVASGKVHFAKTEKASYRLSQQGIEFVGTKLLAKHLPAALSASGRAKK